MMYFPTVFIFLYLPYVYSYYYHHHYYYYHHQMYIINGLVFKVVFG